MYCFPRAAKAQKRARFRIDVTLISNISDIRMVSSDFSKPLLSLFL